MKPITSFTDDYRWLSNFWESPVTFEGEVYPSSEHAYQASKTIIPSERLKIRNLDTPGKAKRAGQRVTLRKDWEHVRLEMMEKILVNKFMRNLDLFDRLVATGTAQLVEGNTWNDKFWGVCRGEGENHLGKILMKIRTRCQRLSTAADDMFEKLDKLGVVIIKGDKDGN